MTYDLPRITGTDIVETIRQKRAATAARAQRQACRGTGACDCSRCTGRFTRS